MCDDRSRAARSRTAKSGFRLFVLQSTSVGWGARGVGFVEREFALNLRRATALRAIYARMQAADPGTPIAIDPSRRRPIRRNHQWEGRGRSVGGGRARLGSWHRSGMRAQVREHVVSIEREPGHGPPLGRSRENSEVRDRRGSVVGWGGVVRVPGFARGNKPARCGVRDASRAFRGKREGLRVAPGPTRSS